MTEWFMVTISKCRWMDYPKEFPQNLLKTVKGTCIMKTGNPGSLEYCGDLFDFDDVKGVKGYSNIKYTKEDFDNTVNLSTTYLDQVGARTGVFNDQGKYLLYEVKVGHNTPEMLKILCDMKEIFMERGVILKDFTAEKGKRIEYSRKSISD